MSLFPVLQASDSQRPVWTRDESFRPQFSHVDPDYHGVVTDFAFQPDNKVVAVGTFTLVNGTVVSNIVRLNFDGSLDTNSMASVQIDDRVQSVFVDPLGRIVIAGWFDSVNGQSFPGVARLLSTGDIDASFDPFFFNNRGPSGALRQPDGKILVFGAFLRPESYENSVPIIRLHEDGSLDESFFAPLNFGTIENVLGAALQPDGKILLAGSFNFEPNGTYYNLIRLRPDGSIDTEFQHRDDIPFIRDIEVQPDGRIVVGEHRSILRLLPSGEMDPSFASFTELSSLKTINLQPDGAIGYYGFFTNGLVNATGSLEGTMQVEPRAERFAVHRMISGPDGNVWIGGGITTIDGEAVFGMMRLIPSGARTYEAWALQSFPAGSPRTGPDESFSNDGIPNLVKYAFAVDPGKQLEAPLTSTNAGSLNLRFNAAASDLAFYVDQSDSLSSADWDRVATRSNDGTWTTDGIDASDYGTGGGLKLSSPDMAEHARFFRISVELIE